MPDRRTRRDIVALHIHDTTCYVLAQRDPCTTAALAQREANRMRTTDKGKVGRDIRTIGLRDLSRLKPKGSWLLVVLLCKDDDLSSLVSWVKVELERADRVRIYHHVNTRAAPLLASWIEAGLPMPRIDAFRDRRSLSARFGLDIVQRIADDFGPSPRRPPL